MPVSFSLHFIFHYIPANFCSVLSHPEMFAYFVKKKLKREIGPVLNLPTKDSSKRDENNKQ